MKSLGTKRDPKTWPNIFGSLVPVQTRSDAFIRLSRDTKTWRNLELFWPNHFQGSAVVNKLVYLTVWRNIIEHKSGIKTG
jgi:hypothetical protein